MIFLFYENAKMYYLNETQQTLICHTSHINKRFFPVHKSLESYVENVMYFYNDTPINLCLYRIVFPFNPCVTHAYGNLRLLVQES